MSFFPSLFRPLASSSRLISTTASTSAASSSSASAAAVSSSATASARSTTVPGYKHYLTPLRKLSLEYHQESVAQRGLRDFIRSDLLEAARENPDVEFIVRRLKSGKAGLVKGHYVNGRDKVVCVNTLDRVQVGKKIDLLLSSSGSKLKHLKNLQLEAGPGGESARGVWSGLHTYLGEGAGGVGVGVGIAYDEGGLALESGERRQVSGRRARLGYCRLRVVI